uniref:uncharacterized protein LOC120333548 n=1 Tax=Styela clava TaxID=7725 RepID=UPI00193A6771|nr:uncharacterized protein LOC120333548 [Styela clava]
MATIGTESQNKDVWNHVEEECKTYYEFKKEEIRLRKAAKIQDLETKANELLKKYEEKMDKLSMDMSSGKLLENHNKYYWQALHEYELINLRNLTLKIGHSMRKQLMTKMNSYLEQLKRQRETLENLKQIKKEKKEFEKLVIQKAARDCLGIFQQKMAQISKEFKSKIEEVCQKERQSTLRKYDKNCESFTDKDEVIKCRKNLEDKLEEHFQRAVRNNKRNMEKLKSECVEHTQTAAREYDEKMKNLMRQKQSLEEKSLATKHAEFKKFAISKFCDLLHSMTCSPPVSVEDEFKMKLNSAMNEKYQVYEKTNERERMKQKMNKDSGECARHAKTALDVYTQDMDQLLEKGENYSEQGLLSKHETCESKALHEFENLTAKVTCSQGNFREDLMKEIKEKFFQYKQMNRKNYDKKKQKHIKTLTDKYEASKHIKTLTDKYEASMKEWAERRFPIDEVLKTNHKLKLIDVRKEFSTLMESKETAEDKKELEKEMDEVYLKIQVENKKARDEREFLKRQKKQKHIKTLTDKYEASMKEWAERHFPIDEVLEMTHKLKLIDVRKEFSTLMESKETAEDKKELEKEMDVVYLKIQVENKKARDEREFLKRQKELNIRSLQVISESKSNDFIRIMNQYEKTYEKHFENIARKNKKKVLKEFDEETKDLRDSIEEKILEAKNELERKIDELSERGIQRNDKNLKWNETQVDNAVKQYVLKYQEILNELMQKSYLKSSGFEVVERRFLDHVDAQVEEDEAIKERIRNEIKNKTEQAKIQNKKNKIYRSVTETKDTILKYLGVEVLIITFPVWVPLAVLGLVVVGTGVAVVKVKDGIKEKIKSRK